MIPYFSIIIPIYNAEHSIVKTLDSIIIQTFTNWELILINDGSKDETESVVKTYIGKYEKHNIKYITKDNSGSGATRNMGINISSGEYIVFIDADDYINNDYLYNIYNDIQSNDSELIFINIIRETYNGNILRYESMDYFQSLAKDRMLRWQLTGKMPWGGVRKVVKSSILKQYGIKYSETIRVGEESIYSFLVLLHSTNISFAPNAIYHYVENQTSLTSTDKYENSLNVFTFIKESLEQLGYIDEFKHTINSLALTTLAIQLNLISKRESIFLLWGEEISVRLKCLKHMFGKHVSDKVDIDSLDTRIKVCYPILKLGLYRIVVIICYIVNKFKSI